MLKVSTLLTDHLRHINKYILPPWSRVLLEKITVSPLVKKFPACYGNPRIFTAFTRARQLSLS